MAAVPDKVSKMTAVRLPLKVIEDIDSMFGKGQRSKFIVTAIEKELKRQKRLNYISNNEGFIAGDLVPDRRSEEDDTLAFVNRLRASDRKID